MFDNNYLHQLGLDFTYMRHYMIEKVIAGLNNYSSKVINNIDMVNTFYYLLKVEFENAQQAIRNSTVKIKREQVVVLETNLHKYAALTKVGSHVTELLNEINIVISTESNYFVLPSIFRQIVEYFVVLDYLLENDLNFSNLYLNHATVLEYHMLKNNKNSKVERDLEEAYDLAIKFFMSVHGVDEKTAIKEYKNNYGWLYNHSSDTNDLSNPVTSKYLRENVLTKYFDESEVEMFSRLVKTADLIVHPTSAYLYYLTDITDGDTDFNHSIFFYMMTFIAIIYKQIAIFSTKKSIFEKLLNVASEKLLKIKFEDISEPFIHNNILVEVRDEFLNTKSIDPIESSKLLLKDFEIEKIGYISFSETQKFHYDNLNEFKSYISDKLDRVFTLMDVFQINFSSFVLNRLQKTTKLENFNRIFWILTYKLKILNVSYSIQNITLFQRVYRSFIEYYGLLHKLLLESEMRNVIFKDQGYLQIEETLFSQDYDNIRKQEIIEAITEKLNISKKLEKKHFSDFMSWTLFKNMNNKWVKQSIQTVVEHMISIIDTTNEELKI